MALTMSAHRARLRVFSLCLDTLERRALFDATPHSLFNGPLTQNWEWGLIDLIQSDNNWDSVPSIEGFTGSGFPTNSNGTTDPQSLTGPDTFGVKNVKHNVTSSPSTYSTGGVAELQLNPSIPNVGSNTVALQGSLTSDAPYLKFYLDATNTQAIRIRYDLVDIDNGSNSPQQFALHYRVGASGNFINLPAGYVSNAGAPTNGNRTSVDVTLPSTANGATHIEVRVMTANAPNDDQLIAVENINISATRSENPVGEFSLSAPTYSVAESVGNATFTVRRLNGDSGPASVSYSTLNGTALAGSDYTATTGVLDFADGVTTRTFTVPILNDAAFELDESFGIALSNPTGGSQLGSPATATVTIAANDAAGEFNFDPITYSLDESSPSVTLTVTRTNGAEGAASVNWTTIDGTAIGGSDFGAASGVLNFAEGETFKTITLSLTDDLIQEANEQFTVVLSDATVAALGSATTATVTILNNDVAGAVTFDSAFYTRSESDGSVTVTVRREGGSSGAVSVNWATVDGSAVSPDDFVGASGLLQFQNNQAVASFTIQLTDDSVQESNEQFTIVLSNPTNNATLGANSVTTVTITNDDVAGQIAFDPTSYQVLENAGSVSLTVVRTGGSSGPVSVSWAAVDGTATRPGDYNAVGGTLNFANGQTSQTILIPITDDATLEQLETFTVVLSNPTNGASLAAANATVSIADNDTATPTNLLLNEINVNPPGLDLPYQFVELRGTPGMVLQNVYLLELEGDSNQNPGRVNSIVPLSGATVGSNGLLLVRSSSGFAPESDQSGVFNTTLFDAGGIDFQNGSTSFVLIMDAGTFSLTVGTDLDSTNSGTLTLPPTFTLLDAVGALDGNNNDRAYGAVLGPISTADNLTPDAPDAYTRFSNNTTPSSSAAWFWGDLAGTTSSSKQYLSDVSQQSPNFPGGAVLTPGGMLITGGTLSVLSTVFEFDGSSQSIVVTFSANVALSLAAEDFELVNTTAGNVPVTLDLISVSTDGTVARLGFVNTGGISPKVLADGDYQFRVKAGQVSDGMNTLPSDSTTSLFFKTADFNHDRSVTFDDLLLLAQNYGKPSGATFSQGDVNYDGRIDFDDLLALAQRYGTSLSAVNVAPAPKKRATFGQSVID